MKINNYDISKTVIDKDVAKPKKSGGRDNKWFMLFVKMKIDDSFAIPFENDIEMEKIKNAIVGAKRQYAIKHDNNFKGSIRVLYIKKEVRFWRDK